MDRDYYVRLGKQAILGILETEDAAVWLEIEAKAAEHRWGNLSAPINPHLLSVAKRALLSEGLIDQTISRTRGGHSVTVFQPADLTNRKRRVQDAAARKRLLHARHVSWARGTKRIPGGLVGPGGEKAVVEALRSAAWVGYRLERTEPGDVHALLGEPVPGGALDNAAFLQLGDERGIPTGTIVLPIEVKNLRTWIYPRARELHQLLYKGAMLQAAHPTVSFLPVLACRRYHFWTLNMARDLGFYVIGFSRQFVLPHSELDRSHVEEVRTELGYSDVSLDMQPQPRLVKSFEVLPKEAATNAELWRNIGARLVDNYDYLRRNLDNEDRREGMNQLRDAAFGILERDVSW